jgi:hypothetical protein
MAFGPFKKVHFQHYQPELAAIDQIRNCFAVFLSLQQSKWADDAADPKVVVSGVAHPVIAALIEPAYHCTAFFSCAAELSGIAVISARVKIGDWGWARLGSGRANSHWMKSWRRSSLVIIECQYLANQPPCPISPLTFERWEHWHWLEVVEAFIMIDAPLSLFLAPCPLCQ